MFRLVLLFACIAYCCGHAVLPLAHHVPAVHAGVVPVAPYSHGYSGYGHGYLNHGYGLGYGLGHGYGIKPVHHLLKRSPHIVHPVGHIGHVAPVAIAPVPVAVSHQSRVDLHSSPVVAPVLHAAPLLHKPVVAPLHYGGAYPHFGLGHY